MTTTKKTTRFQELETLAVLAAFLLVLNLFQQRRIFASAALALLLIGLFIRPVARLISGAWLKFAGLLGAFNSKVILSLVYFLFLTPLAVLFRLFTPNPLQLKNASKVRSLYIERNHRCSSADFDKMW